MSVDTIQYVPPDIEGKVPEEVMRTAISEMTEGDQVSAHHENEGMTRDYFFGE